MSKYIISQEILGQHFVDVAVTHANHLLGGDVVKGKKIQTEFNSAQSLPEFVKIFENHFSGEIILKL